MEHWIIPCNLKYYDVVGAFRKLSRIDWKQSMKNVSIGDIVYVYVGKPIMAIMYKCRVTKINLPFVEIDDNEFVIDGTNYENYGNHMELELVESYAEDQITMDLLSFHGMKGRVQGPRRTGDSVQAFLDSIQGTLAN